jgi:hypothetical protein
MNFTEHFEVLDVFKVLNVKYFIISMLFRNCYNRHLLVIILKSGMAQSYEFVHQIKNGQL